MRISWMLAAVAAWALAEPAAGAPRCSTTPDTLTFGTGSVVLSADIEGRVGSETALVTSCGATLTFAAGTELRSAQGAALIGPVRVTVKDFKGPKNLEGGVTAEAGLLVTVALDAPTGADVKVPSATFEPAARLVLPDVGTEGTFYVSYLGALADGSAWLGKGKPAALEARDDVMRTPVLESDTLVDGSGPVLFDAVAPAPGTAAAPSARGAAPPPRSNLIPIPPGDSVRYVRIINDGTSQITGVTNGSGLGTPDIELGETEVMDGGAFTASVVEIDGQRYLEIGGTAAGADLTIQYRLTSQGFEGEDHREEAPGSGGGDESDPDAIYEGFIDITIIGCGDDGFLDFMAASEVIQALGIEAHASRFDGKGSGFVGLVTAHGVTDSVQELAAQLPPGWTFEFGNRKLEIRLPCPPPIVYAVSADTLYAVDFDLSGVIASEPMPNPLLVFEPNAGPQLIGVDDASRLVTIDPTTLVSTQTRIVATGADADSALPLVFVTAPGRITAYDEDALEKAWSITIPGRPALTSPAATSDGSLLFVRAPGDVLVIDVLRERVMDHIAIPGNGPIAVHPELPMIAALDPGAGQVWTVALPGGAPQAFVAGPNPSDAEWVPDQPTLMVTSFAADQLRFIPPGNAVPVPDGPVAVEPVGGGVFFIAAQNAGLVERVDGGVPFQQLPIPGVELLEVAR